MSVVVKVTGQPRRLINQLRDRFSQINRFFPMAMLAVVILALPAGSDLMLFLLNILPIASIPSIFGMFMSIMTISGSCS